MYTQKCLRCDETKVVISKIEDRDKQSCSKCGMPLQRQLDVPGMVYAPTSSNGGVLK